MGSTSAKKWKQVFTTTKRTIDNGAIVNIISKFIKCPTLTTHI